MYISFRINRSKSSTIPFNPEVLKKLDKYYSKNYNLDFKENKIIISKQKKTPLGFGENNQHLLRVFDKIQISQSSSTKNLIQFNISRFIYFSIIVLIIVNIYGLIYDFPDIRSYILLNLVTISILIIGGLLSLIKHIKQIKKAL